MIEEDLFELEEESQGILWSCLNNSEVSQILIKLLTIFTKDYVFRGAINKNSEILKKIIYIFQTKEYNEFHFQYWLATV